ncbi:hypothetical protein BDV96DRAFT_653270 [Lophiotrema nucula]|uniref:Uncharacterized protein n=1 Tax=Lophiotrema nucula TaxID=690887 RepID=A0A6A5YLU3_9PLEO|nr:hypothetical protein BDV96DRAFT_653270 [Lophiotrema nucula]
MMYTPSAPELFLGRDSIHNFDYEDLVKLLYYCDDTLEVLHADLLEDNGIRSSLSNMNRLKELMTPNDMWIDPEDRMQEDTIVEDADRFADRMPPSIVSLLFRDDRKGRCGPLPAAIVDNLMTAKGNKLSYLQSLSIGASSEQIKLSQEVVDSLVAVDPSWMHNFAYIHLRRNQELTPPTTFRTMLDRNTKDRTVWNGRQ